jgi:hypothetical protein
VKIEKIKYITTKYQPKIANKKIAHLQNKNQKNPKPTKQ